MSQASPGCVQEGLQRVDRADPTCSLSGPRAAQYVPAFDGNAGTSLPTFKHLACSSPPRAPVRAHALITVMARFGFTS